MGNIFWAYKLWAKKLVYDLKRNHSIFRFFAVCPLRIPGNILIYSNSSLGIIYVYIV